MNSQPSTENILAGCLAKNRTSQQALVSKYSGLLYSICRRYMSDDEKAKDVLQESFIKIFKSINSYDSSKGAFEAWMRTIAVNTALSQIRKDKNLKFHLFPINDNHWFESASIIDELNKQDLLKIIQQLPEGYRQVFNLYAIEGYKHKEIGDMLGLTEGTSRSQYSRAREQLKKMISQLTKEESCKKII